MRSQGLSQGRRIAALEVRGWSLGKIAIQTGDEILVGVTPDNTNWSWAYEDGSGMAGADKNGVVGIGKGVCTFAEGASYMPGTASLDFSCSGPIYVYDCLRLPYESPGEDQDVRFVLRHDDKAIEDQEGP